MCNFAVENINRKIMKKLLFLLVLLPLLGVEAKAQVESMFGERAVPLAGKVVRAWDAGSGLISYYENSLGQGTVGLVASSGTSIHEFDLPTAYRMADLRVVDSDVFMCGTMTDSNGKRGVVLRFDANELAAGTPVAIDVQEFDPAYVSRLNRMAAYQLAPDYFKVVAIGAYEELRAPYLSAVDVAVECDYQGGVFSAAQHLMVGVRSSLENYEHLHDVVATDSYVAIVGNIANVASRHISIRVGDRNDVLPTMFGAQPALYYVPTGDVPISVNRAVAMDGDRIATACLSHDVGTQDLFRTQIRYFDLASMTMTNSQWMRIGSKYAPAELAYVPADTSVVLLGEMDFPAPGDDNTVFVFLNPTAMAPYAAYGMYIPREPFVSADCYGGNFVAGLSRTRWLLKDKLQPLGGNCYKYDKRDVSVDDVAPYGKLIMGYRPSNNLSTISLVKTVDRVRLILNCVH